MTPAFADRQAKHRHGQLLAIILALYVAHLTLTYPGIMSWDSDWQYRQAVSGRFDDWHPPVVAFLWRGLRAIQDGPAPLLFLHASLYWLAIYLVADAVRHTGSPRGSWVIVGVGLLPNLLLMTAFIFKDVGMAVSFLAAFALIFHGRVKYGSPSTLSKVLAAFLWSYGALTRANAIFAAAPLLVYMVAPTALRRPVRLAVLIVALTGFLLLSAKFVNRQVFKAIPTHQMMSLKLFDVAGVIYFSGDGTVLNSRRTDVVATTATCYSPIHWDDISRGKCEPLYRSPQPTSRQWAMAVLRHPLAYARHRLSNLNEALYFAIPVRSFDWSGHGYRPIFPPTRFERPIKATLGALSYFPLFSPAVPLAACMIIMFCAYRSRDQVLADQTLTASAYLALSSVAYTGAWLIIGVSSMYRYQQFSMAAGWSASALFMTASTKSRAELKSGKRAIWIIAGLVVAFVTAARGYALLR